MALENSKVYAFILMVFPLVLGCGTLGGEPGEALPGEGKADFGEAFPIELCLGSARIVPFSEAEQSAGLCVPQMAAARICEADAECAGIEKCVCGRCIVQACQGAASCEKGLVCRGKRCTIACASDSGCAADERCISGGCARACGSDAQCYAGERCDSLDQVCAVKLCGGALSCAPGDACEAVRVGGELREPNLIKLDGKSIAFFEMRGAGSPQSGAIYRARVDSRLRWTVEPEFPVLSPADNEFRIGAPSLRILDGEKLMLYAEVGEGDEGARIVRAISSDGGLHFERDAFFSFEPSAGSWEAGRVASPSAFSFKGGDYFFYEGAKGAGIGLARVLKNSAERVYDQALITSLQLEDKFFWRGITNIGAPHAMVVDEVLYVYVSARGAEGADTLAEGENKPALLNDSIGLLASRDLQRFEAFATGPVFARTVNLRTSLGEREASVELLEDKAAIVFVSADASGENNKGLFRAESRP